MTSAMSLSEVNLALVACETAEQVAKILAGVPEIKVQYLTALQKSFALGRVMVRLVLVNRDLTSSDLLADMPDSIEARDLEELAILTMPSCGQYEELVPVIFFQVGRYTPKGVRLERENGIRGLKSDPYALIRSACDDPSMCRQQLACQWSRGDNWYSVMFSKDKFPPDAGHKYGNHCVVIHGAIWGDDPWFAGTPVVA